MFTVRQSVRTNTTVSSHKSDASNLGRQRSVSQTEDKLCDPSESNATIGGIVSDLSEGERRCQRTYGVFRRERNQSTL